MASDESRSGALQLSKGGKVSVGLVRCFDYVPPMIHVNIPLPPDLQQWIDSRVADGAYVDAGDYVRDLLRRDQTSLAEFRRVKALIDEGLASEILDQDPREIIDEIIAEDPDLRG